MNTNCQSQADKCRTRRRPENHCKAETLEARNLETLQLLKPPPLISKPTNSPGDRITLNLSVCLQNPNAFL